MGLLEGLKKLAENLSFEILNPILTETLIEMLKER